LNEQPDSTGPRGVNPVASLWIFVCLALLVVAGVLAFTWLQPSASPPPKEIADDPLLVRGRVVFLDRCASCHGATGVGDGPTAKGLAGPPVGNLTDAKWKHGDAPEQVLAVIKGGVKESQMPGWGNLIRAGDVKAVAAYVYHLARRPVPEVLRAD
jgi:cytochrome c oxidase cbb3-type subunit 3